MKVPFFSVIIPTLNEEKYLPDLLIDLVGQNFRRFEVIVVDGHSDDRTVSLAKSYGRKLGCLKIVDSPQRNLQLQRNLGAAKAKGKYIVLLEADVRLPPNYLREIYAEINQSKRVILTTLMDPDRTTPVNLAVARLANILTLFLNHTGKPFAGGFNTIVRRDIFDKAGGYREDLAISDDHDFATRVLAMGYTLKVVGKTKIIYSFRRIRSKGVTSTLWVYVYAGIRFIFLGPLQKKQFRFDMGGHIHSREEQTFRKPVRNFLSGRNIVYIYRRIESFLGS